ncbi:hypothetical protein BLNAU_19666 [Blattamonas nauphoetae]|uniref:Uncharacterized protein n=1 Tax=Blattamonas nauphoetae TaxID=2049346 RepID=A0ABQ9X127_9EUKA|nr:hypothetical protein BLNAU_19666 [Blattamonas nauphoetae]
MPPPLPNRRFVRPRGTLTFTTGSVLLKEFLAFVLLLIFGGGLACMIIFKGTAFLSIPIIFSMFVFMLIGFAVGSTKSVYKFNFDENSLLILVHPSHIAKFLFCKKPKALSYRLEEIVDINTTSANCSIIKGRRAFSQNGEYILDPNQDGYGQARSKFKIDISDHTNVPVKDTRKLSELQRLCDHIFEYHGWAVQTGLVEDESMPPGFRDLAEPVAPTHPYGSRLPGPDFQNPVFHNDGFIS